MIKYLIYFTFLMFITQNACAKEVFIQIGNGISGLAEYSEGDNDKPAVLVLHGIFQTKEFSTIRLIGDHLEDSGYSTLRPTLSLGLDSRRQSLACEAIHTHSMETDITEITKWVDWLQKKTGKPVILVAHSAGATQLVAYLDKNKDKLPSFQKSSSSVSLILVIDQTLKQILKVLTVQSKQFAIIKKVRININSPIAVNTYHFQRHIYLILNGIRTK